ncbi:MAG: SprB repeat-containing protein, partial [Saprospiraceae bacterium]|nr:SprB repeat-containing protein [Saprospiraceae bacterium]
MRNLKFQFGAGRAKGGTKNRNLHLLVLLSLLLCGQMLHAQLSVSFSLDEPSCFGLPDGNITATASGGVAPYNFTWSNGTMGAVLSGVPAGNYSVTVTDNNGAVTTQNVVLTQPTLVTATLVADQCNNPITITAVGNGGVPPYMYNWTNGEETATISVNPGTYCVTLTDMNYCGTVECITVNNVPLNVAVATQGLTCPGANDGVLTANVTGGTPPFSYLWSTGATSQSIGNLAPGAYGVTVTDANGCSNNAIGVVSDQAPIVINTNSTNPTCTNDTNGNASASASGGTPPYTYQWSNGQSGSFITNLGPGTYTVTVTDANGCIMQASVSLSPVSNLVVGATATPETCVDFNNGTATAIAASGVQPYTYQWSNGATTASLNNLAPGTYTVTVTDAVFCTGFATVTVEAAPDFNISLTNTNVTTCGANNGTATVTITAGVGPFTYLWNTGSTSPQLTGLPGGVYMVTVTDGNGCQIFGQTNVIEPPAVNVELTATSLVCQGDDNGSVNISLTGGTPPFQYNWSNGASTPFLMNVGAGTYSLTVVDAFGCSDVDQVTINEAPAVNVSVAGTTIVCGSGNLGSATALVSGGTAPFQYQWSNGATTSSVNNLPEGTFSVSVIDANGCMAVGM